MRNLVFLLGLATLISCQPAEEAAPDAATEEMATEEMATEETASTDDFTDPTQSDPDHYQVVLENDHVRALRITYAAGEESAMHSHPASVSVFLTDGSGVLTLEDGTEQEMSFEAGDVIWMDAQSHQPRANTDFELIQVELKGR